LKAHSGEKSNKCNRCDYASSQAGDLMRHLETHSGEKSNKFNHCDFASSQAGQLMTHLKGTLLLLFNNNSNTTGCK
jgi:KRAB domain-containing zinc finger protein